MALGERKSQVPDKIVVERGQPCPALEIAAACDIGGVSCLGNWDGRNLNFLSVVQKE
jgi:hypothetical protein